MMVLKSPRQTVRRLVAAALILALIVPSSVAVGRAEDEPVTPDIGTPTGMPTATPTAIPTAVPTTVPTLTPPPPTASPTPARMPAPASNGRNPDHAPSPALTACAKP